MEAVRVKPKNAHKTVQISYPDDRHDFPFMYFHLVFRLTLPSGLRFAFDPTGAQNGWKEYLAPWDSYEQHRIHFIKDARTLDAWGPEWRRKELDREALSTGEFLAEMKIGQQCRLAVTAIAVDDYLGLELPGRGMDELLHRTSDDRFEAVRELLVKTSMMSLRSYAREIDEGPTEKLFRAPDSEVYVTRDSKLFHSLQKAWFTEAEYMELLGDGSNRRKLDRAWIDRLDKVLVVLEAEGGS